MQDCAKLLPHTRPLWRFLPPSQPCPGGPSMHLSLGLPDSLSFVLLQSSPLLSALSYQPEGMLGTTHLTMSLFCSTIYICSPSFPGGIWLLTGCPENFCMPTSSCLLHLPAPASGIYLSSEWAVDSAQTSRPLHSLAVLLGTLKSPFKGFLSL